MIIPTNVFICYLMLAKYKGKIFTKNGKVWVQYPDVLKEVEIKSMIDFIEPYIVDRR